MRSKIIIKALRGLGLFLLLISVVFESLPLIPGSTTLDTFRLMIRQRSLEERIVKNTLILAYRASPDERAEAINELQNTLPTWEKVQTGLRNGDASLGISPNLPTEVKLLLAKIQPNFASIDTSARKILEHPSSVDPVQINIILQHSQLYYLTMAQASDAFQESILNNARIYFSVELAIGIVLILMWIVLTFLSRSLDKRSNL